MIITRRLRSENVRYRLLVSRLRRLLDLPWNPAKERKNKASYNTCYIGKEAFLIEVTPKAHHEENG